VGATRIVAATSAIYAGSRMDFFLHSRDVRGTEALRDDDLLDQQWSYMDGFADAMIARGPTLARLFRTFSR
jgi:hypothetical protein